MRWTARLGLYNQDFTVRTDDTQSLNPLCLTVDRPGFHWHVWLTLEDALQLAQALSEAAREVAEGTEATLELPF
jgi:hypothetical protein